MTYKRARPHPCPVCGEKTVRASIVGPLARLCGRCRPLARDAERRASVLSSLSVCVPALSPAVLERCAAEAAPSSSELCDLAKHLGGNKDALFTGAADAPRVLFRLVTSLHEAGARNVVLPRCASCQKERLLVRATPDGRICKVCYDQKRTPERCVSCHKTALVHSRRPEGPLCETCRRHDPDSFSICASCQAPAGLARRGQKGPLCRRCYRRPTATCTGCGKDDRVTYRRDGVTYCPNCYRKRAAPRRPCGGCGRVLPVNKRGVGGDPDLCVSCNTRPLGCCTRCGQQAPILTGRRVKAPLCVRCAVVERVDTLLTGAGGTVHEALRPLRDVLVSGSHPAGALSWLSHSDAPRLLRELAKADELSHELLDRFSASRTRDHLRALLVASGALPTFDFPAERLVAFAMGCADNLDEPEDRQVFLAFAALARPAAVPCETGDERRTTHPIRTEAAVNSGGVPHLSPSGRALAFAMPSGGRRTLRRRERAVDRVPLAVSFLGAKERCGRGHHPSSTSTRSRPEFAPDDERWALARRLLHDESLDPSDRAAGVLVVIYAQPVHRVALLRREQRIERDGTLYLELGTEPLEIPEPLAGLLRLLPHSRRDRDEVARRFASPWLFPGRIAGRPMHPEYLQHRLGKLGVVSRLQRSAALLQLASELPSAVLADLLGFDRSTAERWVRYSSGAWVNYAAQRGERGGEVTGSI